MEDIASPIFEEFAKESQEWLEALPLYQKKKYTTFEPKFEESDFYKQSIANDLFNLGQPVASYSPLFSTCNMTTLRKMSNHDMYNLFLNLRIELDENQFRYRTGYFPSGLQSDRFYRYENCLENSGDIKKLLVPYTHYTPFFNVDELVKIARSNHLYTNILLTLPIFLTYQVDILEMLKDTKVVEGLIRDLKQILPEDAFYIKKLQHIPTCGKNKSLHRGFLYLYCKNLVKMYDPENYIRSDKDEEGSIMYKLVNKYYYYFDFLPTVEPVSASEFRPDFTPRAKPLETSSSYLLDAITEVSAGHAKSDDDYEMHSLDYENTRTLFYKVENKAEDIFFSILTPDPNMPIDDQWKFYSHYVSVISKRLKSLNIATKPQLMKKIGCVYKLLFKLYKILHLTSQVLQEDIFMHSAIKALDIAINQTIHAENPSNLHYYLKRMIRCYQRNYSNLDRKARHIFSNIHGSDIFDYVYILEALSCLTEGMPESNTFIESDLYDSNNTNERAVNLFYDGISMDNFNLLSFEDKYLLSVCHRCIFLIPNASGLTAMLRMSEENCATRICFLPEMLNNTMSASELLDILSKRVNFSESLDIYGFFNQLNDILEEYKIDTTTFLKLSRTTGGSLEDCQDALEFLNQENFMGPHQTFLTMLSFLMVFSKNLGFELTPKISKTGIDISFSPIFTRENIRKINSDQTRSLDTFLKKFEKLFVFLEDRMINVDNQESVLSLNIATHTEDIEQEKDTFLSDIRDLVSTKKLSVDSIEKIIPVYLKTQMTDSHSIVKGGDENNGVNAVLNRLLTYHIPEDETSVSSLNTSQIDIFLKEFMSSSLNYTPHLFSVDNFRNYCDLVNNMVVTIDYLNKHFNIKIDNKAKECILYELCTLRESQQRLYRQSALLFYIKNLALTLQRKTGLSFGTDTTIDSALLGKVSAKIHTQIASKEKMDNERFKNNILDLARRLSLSNDQIRQISELRSGEFINMIRNTLIPNITETSCPINPPIPQTTQATQATQASQPIIQNHTTPSAPSTPTTPSAPSTPTTTGPENNQGTENNEGNMGNGQNHTATGNLGASNKRNPFAFPGIFTTNLSGQHSYHRSTQKTDVNYDTSGQFDDA